METYDDATCAHIFPQVAAAREAARREALDAADLNAEDIDVALPEANIIPHRAPIGGGQLPPGFAAMYEQFRLAERPRPFIPPVDPALLRARPIGPVALPEARAAQARALEQAERLRDQLARLREARIGDNVAREVVAGRRGGAPGDREDMVRLLRRDLEDRALRRPGDVERGFAFDPVGFAIEALTRARVPDAAEMNREQRIVDRAVRFLDAGARYEDMLPAPERHLVAGANDEQPGQDAAVQQQPARAVRFREQQPARAVRLQEAPVAPMIVLNAAARNDHDQVRAAILRLAERRMANGPRAAAPLHGFMGRLPEARAPIVRANPVDHELNPAPGNVDQHFVSTSFLPSRIQFTN